MIDIIKNIIKNIKNGVMNIFIFLIRKETRGIGGIFFDYKKENWEKDFKFVSDLGVTFQMLFNSIIKTKYKKKWTTKEKEITVY